MKIYLIFDEEAGTFVDRGTPDGRKYPIYGDKRSARNTLNKLNLQNDKKLSLVCINAEIDNLEYEEVE